MDFQKLDCPSAIACSLVNSSLLIFISFRAAARVLAPLTDCLRALNPVRPVLTKHLHHQFSVFVFRAVMLQKLGGV